MKLQIYKRKHRFLVTLMTIILIIANTLQPNVLVLADTTTPTTTPAIDTTTTPAVDTTAAPTADTTTTPIVDTTTPETTVTPSAIISTDSPSPEPTVTEDVVIPVESEKASIKMLFTTDIHGNLTTTDYETGETVRTGTLARSIAKIKEERSKVPANNSFLFDVGDNLYNYSTDYIYEYNDTYVQPIFQAIKSLNYDAITLGNHEFDYGFPYIKNQVEKSGLNDICVVSNVMDANTNQNIWKENMIIDREIITSTGSSTVRIGIIGETLPKLSSKRTSYKGILTTEDIVENATKQAQKLKEAGADIIVALSHSGIGTDNPANKADNASYALTKIGEIDVVLCGHLHRDFPAITSKNAAYYDLPGVDKETGLANGKNLIMLAAFGNSVGIADLNLEKVDGVWKISDRTSTIEKVTSQIEPDKDVNENYMGTMDAVMVTNYSTILGEIEKGDSYQSYFGKLEDTAAIQIVNDAKLQHGLNYINTEDTTYKGWPVIAASVYEKYGQSDAFDYADFSGNFLKSYLSQIEHYRTGIGIYQITGAQLKEWLNMTASAYETIDTTSNATQSLIKTEWATDSSNYYVFDGIEYSIDPSQPPRYNVSGEKISDSNRITNVTINGKPVNNTDNLIMVCDADISLKSSSLLSEINSQKLKTSGSTRCQIFIKNYIEKSALEGTLKQIQDYNWSLQLPTNKNYLISSGNSSKPIAQTKEWLTWIEEEDDYQYYELDASKMPTSDTSGPKIIATALTEKITGKDVTVAVQANDKSGVSSIKYMSGKFGVNSKAWLYSSDLQDNSFSCPENGVYSILATDTLGNKSIYYVRITNINKNMISTPEVNTFSNRMLKVTGTAEVGATVYVELENGKKYSCTANTKGGFSCSVPAQKSGSTVYVYAVKGSKTSARAEIIVKRTGPNKPTLNKIYSNKTKITGKLNDTYAIPILIVNGTTVYVPKNGGIALYKSTSIYDSSLYIKEADLSVASSGAFTMTLPRLVTAGYDVVLYTIDTLYRNSASDKVTCIQSLPNRPVLLTDTIYNSTSSLRIETDERCKAAVKIGGKVYYSDEITYNSSTLKYDHIVKIPRTKAKTTLRIYAQNTKGKSSNLSFKVKERVPEPPVIKSAAENKTKVTGTVHLIGSDCKSTTVSASKTKVYVKIGKKTYKAKVYSSGAFSAKVKKLAKGDKITVWATNINGTGKKNTFTVK